jgi:hypothetical protein
MSRYTNTERLGINRVEAIFIEEFEWIVREQPVQDMGIDMHVEIVNKDNNPTGQLLALQIKTGEKGYFSEKKFKDKNIIFTEGNKIHLDYWLYHSLPVLLILHNENTKKTYWQKILQKNIVDTGKGWKIAVPFKQELIVSFKDELRKFYYNPNHYTIIEQSDNSHGIAQRVSAKVLVEHSFATSKETMREMIPKINGKLVHNDYHRNKITKALYRGKTANTISIFFYDSIQQVNHGFYFCRTIWHDESCQTKYSPFAPDETIAGIDIEWNKEYEGFSDLIANHQFTKGEYFEFADQIFDKCKFLINEIKPLFELCQNKNTDYRKFKSVISKLKSTLDTLELEFSDRNLPPYECQEIDNILSSVVSFLGNIGIVVVDLDRVETDVSYLVNDYLREIDKKIPFYEYEKNKVR